MAGIPTPASYVRSVKFMGKQLSTALANNITSMQFSQSIDAIAELEIKMVDPNFRSLKSAIFQPRTPVDYAGYNMIVAATETGGMNGAEGITLRCRPSLVAKLKKRQGAFVMSNASAADFVKAETIACGGTAVVQPLSKSAQVSRDTPKSGEEYLTDNTPSSWTTFGRLAQENGYICFEQGNVIYFGKPSWILSTAPVGKVDIYWADANKRNVNSIPVCSRSLDDVETTVSLSLPSNMISQCKVGRRLTIKDIPTFSGNYLIQSVSYSLLGQYDAIRVTATTMRDPKPQTVSDAQLKTWAGSGTLSPGPSWGTGIAKSLNSTQLSNASAIIRTTYAEGFSRRAAIIALATAKQESDLGADRSSLRPNGDGDAGVFQQRTYKGWYGTLSQVNDITYATRTFLKGKKLTAADVAGASNPAGPVGYTIPGLKQIKGWENMSVTRAAQAVQRSAYPNAYAKWEPLATALVDQFGTGKPSTTAPSRMGGKFTKTNTITTKFRATGRMWSLGWHTGADFRAATGDPGFAIGSGTVYSGTWGSSFGKHLILDVNGVRFGYCHLKSFAVSPGQKVSAGQVLGYCDSTGNVTGPHLHVEARKAPYRWPTDCVDPASYIPSERDINEWERSVNELASAGGSSSAKGSVRNFVERCLAQTGKAYVYGAEVSLSNKNPTAFDCSELVEWACRNSGVYIPDGSTAQYNYCKSKGGAMSVSAATAKYGALLFRGPYEHVAVSLGNGRTIEAVDRSYGVRQMSAYNRRWTHGAWIPGLK